MFDMPETTEKSVDVEAVLFKHVATLSNCIDRFIKINLRYFSPKKRARYIDRPSIRDYN